MEIIDQIEKNNFCDDDDISLMSDSDHQEEFQNFDLKSMITNQLKSMNMIEDDVRQLFKRILIIDDEPFNVISMQLSLG